MIGRIKERSEGLLRGARFSPSYPVIALFILLLFSVIALISVTGTYRISKDASSNLLETRAVDIAVNLNFTLARLGLKKTLFSELVEEERWDDLAFLALYDVNGDVVLHSNPHLVGRNNVDQMAIKVISREKPEIRWEVLGTGERVFVLDFPLRLHKKGDRQVNIRSITQAASGRGITYCLRVALHPYPATNLVRKAWFQMVTAGFSLVIVWFLTFFFLWMWRRNERLRQSLERQQHMARLGEMAAVLAHEIRNPLSSIKGFAQLHLEHACNKELGEDLAMIVRESMRLERLTENLLAYARPVRLQPVGFNLEELCSAARRAVESQAVGVELELDCPQDWVKMDREKLLQIVLNLVQNGVEAAGEGGRVSMSVRLQDGVLRIEVVDSGPGIDPSVSKRLTEPFFTTKAKGTGLGLAIVSRLVDLFGGRFRIFTGKDGGAVALVDLPATPLAGKGGG